MKRTGLLSLLLLLFPPFVDDAPAAESLIDPFIGSYSGQAVEQGADSTLTPRDINVTIKSFKKGGFTVSWVTVTHRGEEERRKEYTIDFLPTKREGIFQSAMKTDVFGGAVPLDPMKGDPYVWAAIRDSTLVVYALHITEEGGYEMQVYERTLTGDGLSLRFSRVRDGAVLADVVGSLARNP